MAKMPMDFDDGAPILKYKTSSQLTFTLASYVGKADLATNIDVPKGKIISILPLADSLVGWASLSVTIAYSPNDGYIYLYTNQASGTLKGSFKVLYNE